MSLDRTKAAVANDKAIVGDESTLRVDSCPSIWGINQGQLFGVAKCLTVWDKVRRMSQAPKNLILRSLCAKVRGSNDEGRINKGALQPGDAVGFLMSLGGLDAARNGKK